MNDDLTRIIDARLREIHAAWRAKGYAQAHDAPFVGYWPGTAWMASVGDALGPKRTVNGYASAIFALDALAAAVDAFPVNADADVGAV
jgi:hypothetical protein